jgi:hypothetical protein
MSKIAEIIERLRASEEVVRRFPALREIDPESYSDIEQIHRRMVGSEHWKNNDALQNATLGALREASEFYSHVVRDGRFADRLEADPRGAAAALGREISDEAIGVLKNLREVLAVSVVGPGGDRMTPVSVAVAVVVVAIEVTVVVGITVVTVSPPPSPDPPSPDPPSPPDPPPGPDPGPDPDPPPPPDERFWEEIEGDIERIVQVFEATLIELDKAVVRGVQGHQVTLGARDLSGKPKL